MTNDQIKLLKDAYMIEATRPDGRKSTAGEYIKFITDGNIEINTGTDKVIIDEDNQMIHGINVNNDMMGQSNFPVSIISTAFDRVVAVETVMSIENFKKFLDTGYLSTCSNFTANHKEHLIKWAQDLPIQGQAPSRPNPYYEMDAKVIPAANKQMYRDDGLMHPVTPATLAPVPDEVKNEQREQAAEKFDKTTT